MKYFSIILLLLLISCGGRKKGNEFSVSGSISGAGGKMAKVAELRVGDILSLDSVTITEDGRFSLQVPMNERSFFVMSVENKKVILVPESGDRIKITGNYYLPAELWKVSGSPESESLQSFYAVSLGNRISADSLQQVLKDNEGTEDFMKISIEVDSAFLAIAGNQAEIQREFIDTHPESFANILILNYTLGSAPVLDEIENAGYFIRTDSILSRKLGENSHVKYHHMRVLELKKKLGKNF